MRFKEIYRSEHEDPNLSLGRFYSTDVRKLAAFRQREGRIFPSDIVDPQMYFTQRVRDPNTLYLTGRYRKDVLGYGAFDPIGANVAVLNCWVKKWKRVRRQWLVGLMRTMASFGFREMGLRRLTMTCTSFAKAAERLIRETGFTYEGTLRKLGNYNGPTDILIFGLLKEEF